MPTSEIPIRFDEMIFTCNTATNLVHCACSIESPDEIVRLLSREFQRRALQAHRIYGAGNSTTEYLHELSRKLEELLPPRQNAARITGERDAE